MCLPVVSGISGNTFSILNTVCHINHVAHLNNIDSLFFQQTNSQKELNDKMFVIVHLDQKGLEEHRE